MQSASPVNPIDTASQPAVTGMVACTIAARNYLPQVRVLARSFKQHHPGCRFFVLVVDELDSNPMREDSFEIVRLRQIGLDPSDEHRMPLIYDVTELCTAVKPWLLQTLRRRGATAVLYFDPDIEIFAPLDDIAELALEHTIVLTPHTTEPIPRDNLRLNETDILAAGVYNLGFIAVGSGSANFLAWWAARLRRECFIDHSRMRFVDQRWIDLVPALFPHYILRDPACNVAYWNLHSRDLAWAVDHYEVNGRPLRFFHYSGYEVDNPHLLSKHQGDRPRIMLSDRPTLARICREYRDKVLAEDFDEEKKVPYGFDSIRGGLKLDRRLRQVYREALRKFEEEQGPEPPDPFAVGGEEAFVEWLDQPMNQGSPRISRYLLAIHSARIDLQTTFPDPLGRDAASFLAWFLSKGRWEEHSPEALIPRGGDDPAAAQLDELGAALDQLQSGNPGESVREKIESIRALYRFTKTDAEQLRLRLKETERFLWDTRVNCADATAWARSLENDFQRIRRSAVWKMVKPLWKIFNHSARVESDRLDTDLLFEIEAPTEWTARGDEMLISGWCFSQTGRGLAGIRAKVGTAARIGRYGLERPEVFDSHGRMPLALNCGFEIAIRVPPGKSILRLESIVQGAEWRPFFQHELTR